MPIDRSEVQQLLDAERATLAPEKIAAASVPETLLFDVHRIA